MITAYSDTRCRESRSRIRRLHPTLCKIRLKQPAPPVLSICLSAWPIACCSSKRVGLRADSGVSHAEYLGYIDEVIKTAFRLVQTFLSGWCNVLVWRSFWLLSLILVQESIAEKMKKNHCFPISVFLVSKQSQEKKVITKIQRETNMKS